MPGRKIWRMILFKIFDGYVILANSRMFNEDLIDFSKKYLNYEYLKIACRSKFKTTIYLRMWIYS
jgi:hypothetical protein